MANRLVSKEQVTQVLLKGGKVHYDLWEAKAFLYEFETTTQTYKELGTIRFDTYLRLNFNESSMKLPLDDPNASPFRKLKRYDAWCGYDEFTLREQFLKFYEISDVDTQKALAKCLWRN